MAKASILGEGWEISGKNGMDMEGPIAGEGGWK
jgi:hypothetical protein